MFWSSSFSLQVQVLNTISVLITRVPDIIPYANKLLQFFQKVILKFIFMLLYYIESYRSAQKFIWLMAQV